MSNLYENYYGTSFGFWLKRTDDGNITGYGTAGHSFRDFGLYPRTKPVISAPEVQTITYEVRGRDGLYDATEALTGDVHFYNRTGTFEFVQTGGRQKWDSTYYKLKNQLHGRKLAIVIDEEPDGYYVGRVTVEPPTYNYRKGVAYFTISADLEPWKNSWTLASQKWLWDPFSFETGIINPDMGKVLVTPSNQLVFNIIGTRRPVVPHVTLFTDEVHTNPTIKMYYFVDGIEKEITLDVGDNVDKMPDLVLREGKQTIRFQGIGPNGYGYIRVSYRAGWL